MLGIENEVAALIRTRYRLGLDAEMFVKKRSS
jgi:hypothetical protein